MSNNEAGPFVMDATLWHDMRGESDYYGQEFTTNSGFYDEPTKIDCVNALLYEIRGDKSPWNLAYIDRIEEVGDA